MSTYYDILRVAEDADEKEIKAAYRQTALAYHPDHIPKGVSKRMRDDAAQTWLEIQEAFSVLGDPEKREEYDTLLEEMRRSEEAEKQLEPETSSPRPAPPEPAPADPTPSATPQAIPQPTPQPRRQSSAKSVWLWFCFQAGRHWRKLCVIVSGILYVVNGVRNSETWSALPGSGAIFSCIAVVVILLASDVAWKDKGRYIVNAVTVTSLVIAVIFTASISTPAPTPKTAAIATSQTASPTVTTNTPPRSTGQEMGNLYQKNQKAMQAPTGDNSWLTRLPEEYLFACFEADRSRCSTSITHLQYQPNLNVLVETGEFQDYFPDTDKKFKPSPGRWHTTCALHPRKDGHWIGECTYTLLWPAKGKPDETACTLTTSEEITELTREGIVSGISGKIDWTPRQNPLNPVCPEDSGKKKEFHLVPKD